MSKTPPRGPSVKGFWSLVVALHSFSSDLQLGMCGPQAAPCAALLCPRLSSIRLANGFVFLPFFSPSLCPTFLSSFVPPPPPFLSYAFVLSSVLLNHNGGLGVNYHCLSFLLFFLSSLSLFLSPSLSHSFVSAPFLSRFLRWSVLCVTVLRKPHK